MPERNQSRPSGSDRKRRRHGHHDRPHDERHSKRLRGLPPESVAVRPKRSLSHGPPRSPRLESPEVQFLYSRPCPLPAIEAPIANTPRAEPEMEADIDGDVVMDSTQRDLPASDSTRRIPSPARLDTAPAIVTSAPELGWDSQKPYDACFGMIEVNSVVKSSIGSDMDCLPVKVEPAGTNLAIYSLDSGAHLGSTMVKSSPVICQLVDSNKLVISATLVIPDTHRRMQYIHATLRLVLYASMSDERMVAKALSDADLYLQHPSLSECDRGVPYFNPQYLLRPGASMPRLEDIPLSRRGKPGRVAIDPLAEVEKNRFLQIFESAHDPAANYGIRQSPRLQSSLKEHQIGALAMMVEKECGGYDAPVFPAIWEPIREHQEIKGYRHIVTGYRENKHPALMRGGILADEMGLGKTLSAIALIAWHVDYLESSKLETRALQTTLIITPKSIIPEWEQQFATHVKSGKVIVRTYHGTNRQQVAREWRGADVILATYDTLRSEWAANGPLIRKIWARVILDEAHNIRNPDSKIFSAARGIQAPCRWCLTGTPIQNSLDDFGALMCFIDVPQFSTQSAFKYWIKVPVKKKKDYAFKRLRQLVKATCLRRTKASTGSSLNLPKKTEVQQVLNLEPGDRELYNFFQRRAATVARRIDKSSAANRSRKPRQPGGSGGQNSTILPLISNLRAICDHGEDLLPAATLQAWRNRDVDMIDWQLMEMASQKCCSCKSELEESDIGVSSQELSCGHLICTKCRNVDEGDELKVQDASCPECSGRSPLPTPNQDSMAEGDKPFVKIEALLQNLHREHSADPVDKEGISSRSVVFSCWTRMLDFIQNALRQHGIAFRRIDGQTTLQARGDALKAFRTDPHCRVMLASINCAGEGLNLTAANCVHIMEPQWNPMAEAQAVDRVHRIGQERDVVITRYLIKDSIEFYVRGVQEDKIRLVHQSLSSTEIQQSDINEKRYKKLLEALN